jgi:hypothetical protein
VRRTICLATAGLLLGCSTTTTIHRKHQLPIEAEVIGGTPESIYVADDYGTRHMIARSSIADVDYPGNIHALIGGGLFGYGIFNIAVGLDDCDSEGAAFCTGVLAPAIIGAGLIAWGLIVHEEQQSALNDTSLRVPRRTPPRIAYPPRRPPPDTRPVAPVPVDLPEEPTGPMPTEPGTPNPPASPPAPPPPPAAPAPPTAAPPPASPPAPAPAPAPSAPARVPTKAFPVD